MFGAIFDFFLTKIFYDNNLHGGYTLDEFRITLLGVEELSLDQYLSYICTIVTILFIFVLCCLFIYKIIKLIGGLIR